MQMVRLSMLKNYLISFCEGYSNKGYFRTKSGMSPFHLARVSSLTEQICFSQTNNRQR